MNKKSELLIKNTGIIAMGKIATQIINFFLLPLYTAVLSTSEYGMVDLFNTYVTLLVPLVNLQLEVSLFRFLVAARNDEEQKRKIVSSVMTLSSILILMYLVVFFHIQPLIHNRYKWFLFTNVVAFIFQFQMFNAARGIGDNKGYAIGSFLNNLLVITLNILFVVVLRMGVKGIFLAAFLGTAIGSFYVLFRIRLYKYISFKYFNKKSVKELLKYSLPLVPNELSWWIIKTSDRIIVMLYLGVSSTGILAAATKFSSVLITIYTIFNMAWTESVVLNINDEQSERYISETVETMLRLFSSLCIGVMAIMPIMFPVLVNEAFGESYFQIPVYILASLLSIFNGLINPIYIAYKKTKDMAKNSLYAGVINIVVNIVLIHQIGLFAASISSVVGYGVMAVYSSCRIRKFFQLRLNKKVMLSIAIMMFAAFFVYYIRNIWLSIVYCFVIGIYSLFINRKLIVSVTKRLKKS